MAIEIKSQKFAQIAFDRVSKRKEKNPQGSEARQPGPRDESRSSWDDYVTTARRFPSLIHTCGLAQAVAFAEAKKKTDYLEDLQEVLRFVGYQDIKNPAVLSEKTRKASLTAYLQLSRDAVTAASWLKRYVEALEAAKALE